MKKEMILKASKLIDRYSELKDLIEDYTSQYHDEIYWDLIGYCEDLENKDLTSTCIETLEARVNACETLYKGLVMFNDETQSVYS